MAKFEKTISPPIDPAYKHIRGVRGLLFTRTGRGLSDYHVSVPVLRASLSNQTCGVHPRPYFFHTSYGDDGNLTARVTVSTIVSTDTENIYHPKSEKIEPSIATVATPVEGGFNTAKTGQVSDGTMTLMGTAKTDIAISNNKTKKGESDFGEGIDVTLSISDGANGFQLNPLTSLASPAGTIDGSITLRITGNGNVSGVSAEGRPFPSYAAYSYTLAADGKTVITKEHLKQPETPPVENLTKPIQPFNIIQ